MISDQQLRAHEFEQKRNGRLVRLRNEWQAIQKTLSDVDTQVVDLDFRSLKFIGDLDVSQWKTTDKQVRIEALRFQEQALERQVLKIANEIDADKRARGFHVGPMIHPDPTPNRF